MLTHTRAHKMMYKWIGKFGRSRAISDATWLASLNETQSAGLMKYVTRVNLTQKYPKNALVSQPSQM